MRNVWLPTALILLIFALISSAPASLHARPAPMMGSPSDYLYPHLHNLVWDPLDANHVYATSPIGGWHSFDAGRTWQPLSPATPNLHYGRIVVDTERRILYLYRWGDHYLYRSDDFGEHWQIVSRAMYYQLALAPQHNGALLAIHGDWRLRRSDDGGFTWRDLAQPLPDPAETTLAVAPDGTLYAIANRQLFRSTDSGLSWDRWGEWPAASRPRELLVGPDGALIALIASPDQPSVSGSALWRSTDGANWVAAPLPATRIAVSIVSGGTLWAGSDDGHVWRNLDPQRWDDLAGWRELRLQLARPIALRDDIPYTPDITDISASPTGVVLVGTIHGIYRAATPDGPALLRARGLLPTAALPTTPQPPESGERYFPATGQTLSDPFLSRWQQAGGMITLGMPRTAPFIERNVDSGRDELVQYFERGRIEVPLTANATPTLGRVAAALIAEQGPAPTENPRADCRYFPQTGYNLCGKMLQAWVQYGGVATLGYPLSPANPDQQWFERGRIEQRDEQLFLCLVGNEDLQARGWLP
ncbi:hypothetical protein A6A03_14820 [Chloroflexus islandicus]|uniref:Photosynthesis system II assembly factor Ycf48/Hcf136-like domain-containing protein n=1 Tax=Chloroflexus islandicus TaxID=1707952 RepID=A0A178MBQ4_9CHLR|nr:sialidase family protein [Chloroflexus islandicus]OAN45448.1 hypothetical protein A6A03_14820 [Chloroflexus islandicus]